MEEEDFTWIKDDERSWVFEERLRKAEKYKDEGNVYFRSKDYMNAVDRYHAGLYQVDFEQLSWNFELADKHREAALLVKNPICINLASTRILLGELKGALYLIDEVLKETPEHAKALYKKAICLCEQGNEEQALEELRKAMKIEPNNMAIRDLIKKIKESLKKGDQQVKEMWRGIIEPKKEPSAPNPNLRQSWLSFFNPMNLYNYFC